MLGFVLFATSVWAQKNDVVRLKNGDRITGAIKALDSGQVRLKTDYAGTILIEWSQIQELTSDKGYTIDLVDGEIIYGSLSTSSNSDEIKITTATGDIEIDPLKIVSILPVKAGFWDKIDGSFELGLAYDKSTSIGRYTVYADATYRKVRRETTVRFQSIFTTQSENDNSHRTLLDGVHTLRLPEKRFRNYFASLEHNDELGLDLRTMFGIGYGYSPVRSNTNWLDLSVGLAANHEQPIVGFSNNNIEAVLGVTYRYFSYREPERSFKLRFQVFPNLTDSGRYRAVFDTDFRLELYRDVYWSLKYYASFDNQPLTEEASDMDYGINTSVGISF